MSIERHAVTMERVLAIDPGIRGCGAAVFHCGALQYACYVKNPFRIGDGPGVAAALARKMRLHFEEGLGVQALVLEYPQVYRVGLGKGDPNDLLSLAAVDGAIAALFSECTTTHYKPREWKGQIEPEACIARIQGRLSPHETTRVQLAGALSHNVWDAVGLGLYHIGRFHPKRVYPT